jgi:N-methylhydantoinase A
MVEADVVERAHLAPGRTVRGPAVVQEAESTVVIGAGATGLVEASGALVVEIDD